MCYLGCEHELGGGGVEGWTSRESSAEDPGDGSPAGQTEEGKDPETVSAGFPRSCSAKTKTKSQCSKGMDKLFELWIT